MTIQTNVTKHKVRMLIEQYFYNNLSIFLKIKEIKIKQLYHYCNSKKSFLLLSLAINLELFSETIQDGIIKKTVI